jgi:RNA polymerase sigma-70 factor (ECF subfamily)
MQSADVDDLTQDVAVAAFAALPQLRQPEKCSVWLQAIARNVGRNALRAVRSKRVGVLPGVHAESSAVAGDPAVDDSLLSHIDRLPQCHRLPLTLRFGLQLSGSEIAERTGMTAGSVRVNICRGLKILRRLLKDSAP